jgi:hypothetical protein
MKVCYTNGCVETFGHGKKDTTFMGTLVPVPDGFDPVVQKPKYWDDAIEARAIQVLIDGCWATMTSRVGYNPKNTYCIRVSILIDYLRKVKAVQKTELKQTEMKIRDLENEG